MHDLRAQMDQMPDTKVQDLIVTASTTLPAEIAAARAEIADAISKSSESLQLVEHLKSSMMMEGFAAGHTLNCPAEIQQRIVANKTAVESPSDIQTLPSGIPQLDCSADGPGSEQVSHSSQPLSSTRCSTQHASINQPAHMPGAAGVAPYLQRSPHSLHGIRPNLRQQLQPQVHGSPKASPRSVSSDRWSLSAPVAIPVRESVPLRVRPSSPTAVDHRQCLVPPVVVSRMRSYSPDSDRSSMPCWTPGTERRSLPSWVGSKDMHSTLLVYSNK